MRKISLSISLFLIGCLQENLNGIREDDMRQRSFNETLIPAQKKKGLGSLLCDELTTIQFSAKPAAPYITDAGLLGSSGIPRFEVQWSSGPGTQSITFDAEPGSTLSFAGTAISVFGFFDDIGGFASPGIETNNAPPFVFSWTSGKTFSAIESLARYSRARAVTEDSGLLERIPNWAYSVNLFSNVSNIDIKFYFGENEGQVVFTQTMSANIQYNLTLNSNMRSYRIINNNFPPVANALVFATFNLSNP